jgi:hypothetical protein
MSGSDGRHQVKVDMNGQTVLSVAIASPYSGADVKTALRAGYNSVRQVYVLSCGLLFIKNNRDELEALVGLFTRGPGVLNLPPHISCSGSVP